MITTEAKVKENAKGTWIEPYIGQVIKVIRYVKNGVLVDLYNEEEGTQPSRVDWVLLICPYYEQDTWTKEDCAYFRNFKGRGGVCIFKRTLRKNANKPVKCNGMCKFYYNEKIVKRYEKR